MSYIKLDDVNETLLLGAWKIKNRLVNSNTVGHVFATSNCIKFTDHNNFIATSQDGKKHKGQWEIIREREVIYNPQVKFQVGKDLHANSIITTLTTDDNIHFKLILYFDSGLELVLEKESGKDSCRKNGASG